MTEEERAKVREASRRFSEAVSALVDGQAIIAADFVVLVAQPNGDATTAHFTVGKEAPLLLAVQAAAARIHSNRMPRPDHVEERTYPLPIKH